MTSSIALPRRLARRQALLQPAFDVLDHHDGVIDHDADGQDQTEEGDVVQAEAEGGHDGEGADDGDGDGDQRDEGGPPVLQERQDDNGDQHHRLQQGLHHVGDRLADERRGVVGDCVVNPLREVRLELLHLGPDPASDVQRVGAGQLKDGQAHGRVAVEGAAEAVVLRAQFDAAHVAQPHDAGRRPTRPAAHRRGAEYAAAGNAGRRTGDRRSAPQAGRTPVHHSGGGPAAGCGAADALGAPGRRPPARACSHPGHAGRRAAGQIGGRAALEGLARTGRRVPRCHGAARGAAVSPCVEGAGGAEGGQAVGARRGREGRAGRWGWLALVGLDDQVAELLRGGEPAQGVDRQLERLRPGGRLLAQHPGRGVEVLVADGVGHVEHGHVQRRQLLRVEPDADAVVAHALVVDLRNPVDAEQLVQDVDGGIIAQVDVVVAAVRRVEADDVQDVGRLLADGDALVLDRGRQQRHGQLHAVLDHDQGGVQVGADVEGDGQHVRAVVAHLRGHVQHALDAVDLLLDRRRHRVRNHLGAGPRVED